MYLINNKITKLSLTLQIILTANFKLHSFIIKEAFLQFSSEYLLNISYFTIFAKASRICEICKLFDKTICTCEYSTSKFTRILFGNKRKTEINVFNTEISLVCVVIFNFKLLLTIYLLYSNSVQCLQDINRHAAGIAPTKTHTLIQQAIMVKYIP